MYFMGPGSNPVSHSPHLALLCLFLALRTGTVGNLDCPPGLWFLSPFSTSVKVLKVVEARKTVAGVSGGELDLGADQCTVELKRAMWFISGPGKLTQNNQSQWV